MTLLGTLWGTAVSAGAPVADAYSEEAVKAAFVVRFISYVEWPAEAARAPQLRIAVLGARDVALRLQQLVANRALMSREVQVQSILDIREVGDAQILYVGTDRRGDLRNLLGPLAGRRILVISSEENALASGSMINLLTPGNRVRFEVSLVTARRAGLKISSELLSLAVRVQK